MNRTTARALTALAVPAVALAALAPPTRAAAPEPRPAEAGATGGSMQLRLDRPAVASLIKAGIPGAIPVAVPGVGGVTVLLRAPEAVEFRDGGLEARIGVGVRELGFRGRIAVRYVPHIVPDDGLVQLRPVRALAEGPLAVLPDLSPMLPPVSVPRGFRGLLHPRGGAPTDVAVSVHAIEITDDELVVHLGLETRPHRDEPAVPPEPVPGSP